MKKPGRWSLAVAVLAISGWAWLRVSPNPAPTAISKPSTEVDRPPDRNIVRTSVIKKDWMAEFHASGSNYFEFLTLAARAGYEGDGAAQYYIGRALGRCEETNALYGDADGADQAVSHMESFPALLELERQEYLECSKLLNKNPFEDLPERRGGYPADYWRTRALESRYPVAIVAAALDSPGQYNSQTIATALATGNGEAMLLFGWSRATAAGATDSAPVLAAAWVLAACHSGANCGPTNDLLPLATCRAEIQLGCTERYTAVDELAATLGSRDLDDASLLAQDIERNLAYHDPGRLMKYLSF
ncbi:MAG TPA: hypothetical protein VGI23_15440 [Steroidobacteraceae bacterium]|jgi:hypothetical protein